MANTLKLRFSSIKDFFSSKSDYLSYEMEAPYTDTYKVSFKKLKSVVIYNEKGIQILLANKDFEIDLTQGQNIRVVLYKGSSDIAELKVMALNHKAVLPYDPYNPINTRKLRTHGDDSVDPLTPVKLDVRKRDDGKGLYINCNNPEKLTDNDIGKALSRVNISNKKVFFTFEHNNLDKPFYYGYQVKNTGKEDLYITIWVINLTEKVVGLVKENGQIFIMLTSDMTQQIGLINKRKHLLTTLIFQMNIKLLKINL